MLDILSQTSPFSYMNIPKHRERIEKVFTADFESFGKRYSDHVRQYDFPLQIKRPFNVLPYPNAAARVAPLILTRDGFDFENGTAEIIRLVDWDTLKTNRFANKAAAYLLNCKNEKLPKEIMVAFE